MLLKTKIHIPTFENTLIKRKRLIEKLEHHKNIKLILITAPAGYGKTSLLSSWTECSIKKQKVTWLMLDMDDNDEDLFWSYLLFSFCSNQWVPVEMKQRVESLLNNQIPFSRFLLTQFINDLTEFRIQIVMILDDIDVIKNNNIISDLEYFICHLPSNVHLVLSGREYFNINLTKYRPFGNILAISEKELAFTQEETITFFRKTAHINLSLEEYTAINQTFEGWIFGIQLMTMTADQSKKLIVPIVTENSFIFAYFMDELIRRLDLTTKDFLIKTSVLDRFSTELCNYIFQIDHSKKLIQKMQHLNLFLTSTDEKEDWFRYHKLFRDFLQILMLEENNETYITVYKRASEWYEAKKYWKEAVDYAVKGHHFDKAVTLIEEVSGEIARKGESSLLHKWNQSLPKELVERNLRLLLNSAWAYSSEGNTLKMYECMNKISKFKKISVQMQAEIVALYSSNLAGPHANLDKILLECRQALSLLAPQDFLAQLLCFNIGGTFLLKGCTNECLAYFEQCYMNSMNANNFYLAVISKKAIITSHIRDGWLQRAEQEILQLLNILSNLLGETLPISGLLYAQLAEIYYQMNELTKALEMAFEGIRYGSLGRDVWVTGENYLILEKIHRAMNQKEKCKDIQKKILTYQNEKCFFDLGIKLECGHILALLSERRISLASRRISSMEKVIKPELSLVYPEFIFLKTRFYMNKGNLKKAEEILRSLKTAAAMYGQKGLLCEVQVLYSTLYKKMGRDFSALKELEEAVILAEEQGNIQFFLNEGAIIKDMLSQLLKKANSKIANSIFADSLLCCFETPPMVSDLSGELLSERETQILHMVSQGAGNEEIADKLFISKNTVKTHLLNIYTKLDVHSRTKAVSKAKALNIIISHCPKGDF